MNDPVPTKVASFRLAAAAHERLYSQAEKAGLSTRAWLEQAILENQTQIIAKAKPNRELAPLLFQVNKIGNNINQLAHHFNAMELAGRLGPDQAAMATNALRGVQRLLREALNHACEG